MIGVVAAGENGRRLGRHTADSLDEATYIEGPIREAIAEAWSSCEGLVLFMATGIAVRMLAPLLGDKRTDPAVVTVDETGTFAVALVGGHEGGANGLAERVAALLGAQPVVTTATDRIAAEGKTRNLVLGVGCSRGASAQAVLDLIDVVLTQEGLDPERVVELRSVEAKADEAGLLEAARRRGWEIRFLPAVELSAVDVPNPSVAPMVAVGTPSVAEAAASIDAELIVPKHKSADVTVAVGRQSKGHLSIIGIGPGALDLIPDKARRAIREAEVLIGFDDYVTQIVPLLRPHTKIEPSPIGDEVARASRAVALAREGRRVALVSSGDAGVYAMASPALEVADERLDVEVIPGVTAALAAAALLGSPLGHDHCAISLSDLMTPWGSIEKRISAAAEADFVVTFYNPRSKLRDWQLERALELLSEYRKPNTVVGVVKDATRMAQVVGLTTLADLDTRDVGMTTVVVVGSTQTIVRAGRMVTPRGYR